MGEVGSMMSGFGMSEMWILLFLGIALLAWVLAGISRRGEQPVLAKVSTVEDVLRERLERGEISAREFEDAMRRLKDS